jgi:hypothetical protein
MGSPLARLHVVQSTPSGIGNFPSNATAVLDSSSNNYVLFRNTADNSTQAGLVFQDNNVGGFVVFKNYTGTIATGSDSMLYGTHQDHIFLNGTSETVGYGGKPETMRIAQNGNVGIGRTDPGYKLDVNGFARMGSYYTGSTNSTVRLAHIFQGPDLPGTFNQVTNDTGTITQKSIQITTASAGGTTFFFGPYYDLGPGNYQAKFRMKVASNSGSSYLGYIDCVGVNIANGQTVSITTNLFTASNQYQYFNLTFTVTAGGGYVETRFLNYQPATNVSLDHILITPL